MSTKEWVGVLIDWGCVLYVSLMFWSHTQRWGWTTFAYVILNCAATFGYLMGHDVAADRATTVAAAIAIASVFTDLEGRGKRLWGKLKSAALTAVNQASFKQQQREAFQ